MRAFTTNRALYFALTAGVLVTGLLLMLAYNKLVADTENRFLEESAQIREQLLLLNLHANELADNISALFHASDYVEPDEFQVIAEEQLQHYPYIHSVSFHPQVSNTDIEVFEKEMQAAGFVTYAVRSRTPASDGSAFPVKFIEPLTPQNATLLGLDMATVDRFGPHISKAIHAGAVTASCFEKLANGDVVFSLFKPLFADKAPSGSGAERENTSGMIAVQVSAKAMLGEVSLPRGFRLSWSIVDIFHPDKPDENSLWAGNAPEQGRHLLFKTLQSESTLDFEAVSSTLVFEKEIYWQDIEYQYPLAALVAGLILTLLLLFAARSFELRDRELKQRSEEIERQVRKQTRNLLESEARLNEAQRIACVGNWELNLATNTLTWSDEIFRIFEIDKERFGASYEAFIEAIHPDDRELVNAKYTASVKSRIPYDVEHRLLFSDGRVKYVHEHCQTFYDAEGNPTRSTGTVQDITERKELEERLLQSQKMEAIGTLAGGIAHDFNNTLAAIQGNLYLAKKQLDDKELLASKLNNIVSLSEHAAEIVRQLLTFARKDIVTHQPFSLTSLLRTELSLFRSIIPENIDYSIELCDEELNVLGDSTQLQQALVNLLNNARDAVRNTEQPKISFTLEPFSINTGFQQKHPEIQGDGVAHLIIRDNGSGIPAATLEHIFEPFYTTKAVGEGTGLGLAMVYGSIQTHGGAVDVESSEGKGTTFHIYLPLCQKDGKQTDKPETPPVAGEGETILLVDDDDDVRSTTCEVLESMGYRVLIASDGQQGLDTFDAYQHEIDLIISDVVMPKMGGTEFSRRAKERVHDIPVILITGYDERQVADIQDDLGDIELLQKPISYPLLSQTLRSLLGSGK
ncbi:PAS domain S-box-containing protein [Mariprofundus ferrinatatus]|uniref:histidine kinase n=1 Tax=Mariprofundus ferrinatatus TaxID=1921087 RepID=A0A2K8L638_9PROT|nr:ATP-binding protein [Mariprofundus ferrinatatus]ATX82790.1 PAS domain S-box-containing protein [Mariprofundus ferrinatatus]